MSAPRYAILHHITGEGEHWDLLLESGQVLKTWQLEQEPAGRHSLPIPARPIADHRMIYLEYEGPISGDRGRVTRVDSGFYTLHSQTTQCWLFELRGGRLAGEFSLVRHGTGDDWRFEFVRS